MKEIRGDKVPRVIFPSMKRGGIAINHYGKQKCKPSNSFGPAKREYFLIHFVVNGKGKYYCGDKSYEISKNQMFLIRPNEETIYIADERNPWEYFFIGFGGVDADSVIESIGCSDNYVLSFRESKNIKKTFNDIFNLENLEDNNLLLLSLVYKLFFQLKKGAIVNGENVSKSDLREMGQKNIVLNKAMQYIEDNIEKNITTEDVASNVGLHRSSLYRLFIEGVQLSVSQYIHDVKMHKAVFYVVNTNMSMSEISSAVGYSDYPHFFRVFKKTYGFSPTEYREKFCLK